MSDYLSFDGQVEPLEWGSKTYTILRLPAEVSDRLMADGAVRVEGELGDHPVNLALTRAPVLPDVFLWAGKALLKEAGLEPGEIFPVRLKKADPDFVDMPEDVTDALAAADLTEVWEALTPGNRRGRLYKIESAKRAATRAQRIARLMDELQS